MWTFEFRRLASAIIVIFLLSLCVAPVMGADVCRTQTFEGMESNKKRAEKFLPGPTSQKEKFSIYIEYTPSGKIYYHSNYVTPGYLFPTKVQGDPVKNSIFSKPEKIILNILYDKPPSADLKAESHDLLRERVDILLDTSMFDSDGVPRVDLSGVKNIRVVDGMKGVVVTDKVQYLTTSNPPPSLISRILGCCFFGRPPHRSEAYRRALESITFKLEELRVVSLFVDSGTEMAFAKNKNLLAKRVASDGRSIKSNKELEDLFISVRGKTVILFGHVEGQDYVIRDASNNEQFRSSIESIRVLAKRESVSLIDIGCETASAIETKTLGVGVITKYNSVDAINSVSKAVTNSKNYAEFMEGMSSEGLKIVVDESFVSQNAGRIHANVYSRMKDLAEDVWVKVASISFLLLGDEGAENGRK